MPKRESLDEAWFHLYLQGMTSLLIGSGRISSSLKANNALCVGVCLCVCAWGGLCCCCCSFFFFLIWCTQFRNFRPLNICVCVCVCTVYMQQWFMLREIDSWQNRLDFYSIYVCAGVGDGRRHVDDASSLRPCRVSVFVNWRWCFRASCCDLILHVRDVVGSLCTTAKGQQQTFCS